MFARSQPEVLGQAVAKVRYRVEVRVCVRSRIVDCVPGLWIGYRTCDNNMPGGNEVSGLSIVA